MPGKKTNNNRVGGKKGKPGGDGPLDLSAFGRPSPKPVKPRRKKGFNGAIAAFAAVFVVMLIFGAYVVVNYLLPNYKTQGFREYFGFDPAATITIIGDRRLELNAGASKNALVSETGELYFPVEFVKENLDKYIYWDEAARKLTVTTRDKVMRFAAEDVDYYVNGVKNATSLNLPVHYIGGAAYLPASLVSQLYNVKIQYMDKKNLAVLDYNKDDIATATVTAQNAPMRYKADSKAVIEQKLTKGETVYTYGQSGDYTRVRAANGLIGYVLTKQLAEGETIAGVPVREAPPYTPPGKIEGKINMIWDLISVWEANQLPSKRVARDSLDVLSPTWFTFDINSLNGDIVNIADLDYVKWAHENGYRVWPVITDNSADTDVISNSRLNRVILTSTENRDNAIRQLLALIATYELDGINVDFEHLQEADADSYVQFFRELAPYMNKIGAALSVDMYNPVPSSYWSRYYSRAAVAESADYICVMAYDEHYGGGDAGPVASLRFVEDGITATLAEVPKEKILLGLPYYVRVWKETPADAKPKVEHYSMQGAYDLFKGNGVTFAWKQNIGAYYGEYTAEENGGAVTRKVWLEDDKSIEEKLKLFRKYDLAGVAGWCRGQEKDEVWDLLRQYVQD